VRTRRIITVTAVLVAVLLAAALIWLRVGLHAGPAIHTVELSSGEVLEGFMFPLYEEAFVLQAKDRCLIARAGDIRSVDGDRFGRQTAGTDVAPVIMQETFEEILPGGEIDVRSAMRYRNTGSKAWREIRWGMAKHELDLLGSYRLMDIYGNTMPVRAVEDRPNGGKLVQVDLRRPLFPGEETWYTLSYRREVIRDDVWIYRHVGDYPDNRLVTRSVLLPPGAQIVSIDPEPLYRIQVGRQWLVVWRRYFLRSDRVPWQIRFRPPPADTR
jgi:hypothetical protein